MDLVLFKLREDLDDGDWGLRTVLDKDYKPVPVKEIPGLEIRLYVKSSKVSIPKWQKDLMLIALDQASQEIIALKNQSTGAVVQIGRFRHRFILVYGTGRHAVDSTKIEASFGLRVAANVIDSEALKGVDTRAIAGSGRNQAVSMPSAGPLHKLGIEPTVDLIRYLEGKPPEELGTGIAGGDSLRLTMKSFSFSVLPQKLDEVILAYESQDYKEKFPFLDYFTRVPRTMSKLHSRLKEKVNELLLSGSDAVDFMNPDSDRLANPDSFILKWNRKSRKIQGELNRDVILEVISEWRIPEPLKSLQVHAHFDDIDRPIKTTLMPYLVTEVELEGSVYAPCSGTWYRIDKDHLQDLQERIRHIPDVTEELRLSPWHSGFANEGEYNLNALDSEHKHIVLDKQLYYSKGGRNLKAEICDLLTQNKEMICVKKMNDSATLSHLFAQGAVSARLFRDNQNYRSAVLQRFSEVVDNPLIDDFASWKIVFAIATNKPGKLADSLFFFSKLNLDLAVKSIHSAGLKVAIAKIELT